MENFKTTLETQLAAIRADLEQIQSEEKDVELTLEAIKEKKAEARRTERYLEKRLEKLKWKNPELEKCVTVNGS